MNCEHLRENIYDYLDESFSRAEKAAAESHLAGCLDCREAVRREQLLAQSLSNRLAQTVEAVALDDVARRGLVTAVARKMPKLRERPRALFWRRLAWRFAAVGVVFMVAIRLGSHFLARPDSPLPTARLSPSAGEGEVVIHVTYSVPGYTFHREGNLVVDALTCDTRVADEVLLAK